MSGFKEGSVQLRKKDVGNPADPNHLKILVDTNNNLYTIDEDGVYRPVGGGYDIQVSGTSLTLVTSASTKIISLNDTGVVSGTYGSATVIPAFKVGTDGRIISVSSMPISATGLGTVTSIGVVSNTLGISSSPITTSGNIIVNLSAIGTSGIFTKFVKDIYGRVTSGGYIGSTDILDRSIDGTLSANSDNKIPTEKAIKTYVDENDKRNSVGIIDSVCNDIIDNGDGTATILPQNVYIFDNSTFQGNLYKFYVAGTTLSFLDGIEQHVCVKYNAGTPIFYVENNMDAINESDVFCTHIVWRQGTTLHSMGRDSKGVGLSNKIARSLLMTHPYSKSIDGGLMLSETSTPNPRTVLITSATVYAGIVPISVLSFNSSIDKLTFAYHSGGNWNYSSATVYQNSQYDDGTNLISATNNKYIVNWFYRSIGDVKETFYVPGVNQYNKITEAQQEAPRSDLSLILRRHCVLVAKVIVLQGASTGLVQNVSDVNFTNSTIPNHNDLNNIQGGSVGSYYHVSASTFGYLSGVSADIQNQLNNVLTKDILEVTKEPTGFPRIDNTKLLFNNSTRYFTLSALSGNYDVYFRGNRIVKTTDTIQIPNLSGLHFIYFTSAGVLTTSQTAWDIFSTIQISMLYWTGVSALDLCEERHGCVMDCATHDYLHKTFKTQYVDGFDASYTKNNATAITFGLTDGIISDEDLSLTASNGIIGNYFTQPLNNSAYLPVYYRSGVDGNGNWRKDTATVYPYKNSAPNSYTNFNELVTGNWVQTVATNNSYVAYFIYATNNTLEPVICVQGQRQDSNYVDALNLNSPTSLLIGDFPFVEAKLLYKIIVGVKSSYSNNFKSVIADVTDYRTLGVTIGGNTGGTGTVTYVGLSANPILSISGSPITNAGNFIIDFSPEASGTFLRGPISGNLSIPTFGPILSSDLPMLSAYTLQTTTSAISASLLTKINSISANYTTRTEVSGVSANLQLQITNNNNSLSAYYRTSGGPIFGNISASGNVTAGNFWGDLQGSKYVQFGNETTIANGYVGTGALWINYRGAISGISEYRIGAGLSDGQYASVRAKSYIVSGGTSTQFLKADGSSDSNIYITSSSLIPYTLTTTTSAISANLQIQITNNNNSLSAYLPLSGGTLTGQLKAPSISASGNISAVNFVGNLTGYKNVDNGNECTISNGFASNQALFVNYRGATSAITQYNFWNGLAGAGTYAGVLASAFIKNGGTSAQFLKANGSVDSNVYITSSSLTPYTLTTTTSAISANLQNQITNNNNKLSAYLPLSGGTLSGQLLIKSQLSASGDLIGSRHIIPGGLSTQFLKADGSVDSNSYALDTLGDYYLPLSGGTLAGDLVTQNIRPTSPFYNDLGSVFFPYASLYVSAINANKINMEGSIIPINSILYDLGSNSNKWRTIYTKDINSVAMSTVFDRSVEAVDVKSHILIGFDNQLAPHLNFSNSLGTSANLSGDFYFDGLNLKIRDKNLSLKTIAYTSELSAYTPTSGFNQTISAYLPLSGGTLTGQLKAPSVSASGNISAVNFVGNLTGYKNVDNGNEITLANGYISSGGDLFINYRGATSSINQYKFCNGKGAVYSGILASAFIKNGGTNSQFLMADGSISLGNNLASYYLPLSGGTLSGNINFTNPSYGYNIGLRGVIGDNDIWGIRGWSVGDSNGYLEIYTEDDGNEPIYVKQYNTSGSWERTLTLLDAFGNTNFPGQVSATGFYSNIFVKTGGINTQFLMADGSISYGDHLSNKFLPLSGGTMSGNINFSNPSYGYNIGLRGIIGDNDIWGVRGWSVGESNGYLEIYTEDDGNEPIYVKQYNTSGSWERTLTLLDASGNTNFPNDISASRLIVRANNAQGIFVGDDASLGDCNTEDTIRVQGVQHTNAGYFRYGDNDATFGFDSQRFTINRNLRPTTNGFDLGGLALVNNWSHVYSEAFVKYGGTSSQFLKADGSVDTNSFSNYLPLAGGTMTGGIYGSGFHSGSIAMLSHTGVASLRQLYVENPSSVLPTNIIFGDLEVYAGCWDSASKTNSIFYNSTTEKSNTLVVSDGNLGLNGGIYFANLGNSYVGQTSDNIMRIRGNAGTTFDGTGDNNITFNEKTIFNYLTTFNNNVTLNGNITNHIIYTTANDVGGVLPSDRTYYKIGDVNGDFILPEPTESKIIYVYNEHVGMGDVYLIPPTGTNIIYNNYSGTKQICSSSSKLLITNSMIITLIGTSSSTYSIIGPWSNPV